jgi:hypothetical protein
LEPVLLVAQSDGQGLAFYTGVMGAETVGVPRA